jgi:PAS domain S-box-containing protein
MARNEKFLQAQSSQASNPAGPNISHSDVEERLLRVEERFRLFMESVKEYAIFMLDTEGRVVDWNFGVEHVVGYGEEIVGQPFAILFPPDDRRDGVPERELRKAIETGQSSDDRWHVRKDGSYFWALGITTAMRDDQGALKGFTKVLRDSTERKRFEEQIRERNHALIEADRRKDEFLAMLSHELRNPLTPIFNALSLLERESLPSDQQRQAHLMIDRHARTLARLVDDLLDVSRITRGKIELRLAAVDLNAIVKDAVETCRPMIDAHRHRLAVNLAPRPVVIDADRTRMEQVIVNLLTNSTKYSNEDSSITITTEQKLDEAIIRVQDNGMGIAVELLPRIFDLFAQADHSLHHSQGGLGIGLTLVKKLVELHGGTVQAHSEGLGKGSEFVIRLPVRTSPAMHNTLDESAAAPKKAENPLRLLVVDDNLDAADSLQMILTLSGHEVAVAYAGLEGVQAALESKPDAMIVDLGLPGMNGYEIAERVRKTPELRDAVLIAMTGYGQEEDRRRSTEAGFDYHFVKPADPQRLEEVLRLVGNRKR